jgi:hypothetical protein
VSSRGSQVEGFACKGQAQGSTGGQQGGKHTGRQAYWAASILVDQPQGAANRMGRLGEKRVWCCCSAAAAGCSWCCC